MSIVFGQACAMTLRTVFAVLMVAALCVITQQSVSAEQGKRELLVTHVSPSVTTTTGAAQPGSVSLSESASSQITGRRGALTQGEKWEQFETEFGVHQNDSSLVKETLASAKYRLDKTVFELQEWVENVEGALKFDHPLPNLTGSSSSSETARLNDPFPFWGSIDNPHLKSDVDLDPFTRRAFVGLKLEIKFGN